MNNLKVMRIISQFLLVIIILMGVFYALIKFKVISFNSSVLPEVVTLNQTEIGLKKGENYQLSADIYPDNIYHGEVVWTSSNPSIASVNEKTGYVTAHNIGDVTITAKVQVGNITSSCLVHVSGKDISITKIDISSTQINLLLDSTYTLKYSFSPSNATTHNLEYISSDSKVAVIDDKGVIKAIGVGKAVITIKARNGNAKDTVAITVYKKETNVSNNSTNVSNEITGVTLSKSSINLVIGGVNKINASVLPKSANQNVTWNCSNNSVAKVDKDGNVTGISIGEAIISATTINGKKAYTKVNVSDNKISVTDINIVDDSKIVYMGDNSKIDFTFLPSNATNQSITWSSSNQNILKVDSNGNIIPVSVGSAIVTAISVDGGYRDFITIEIRETNNLIQETSIKFSSETVSLNVGKTITLNPVISPSNSTYQTFIWSTSDRNIATVDDGMVYGVSNGTAFITATTKYAGLVARIKVDIIEVKPSGITLNNQEVTLQKGETFALIPVVVPSEAANYTIEWISSDSNIVKVSNDGVITGINEGRCIITAKTSNNKEVQAIITVTE